MAPPPEATEPEHRLVGVAKTGHVTRRIAEAAKITILIVAKLIGEFLFCMYSCVICGGHYLERSLRLFICRNRRCVASRALLKF